jgi:hypothetical protein
MGGFNSAFLRIPSDISAADFAAGTADQIRKCVGGSSECMGVQYAEGFDWLHLEGFSDSAGNPMLQWFDGESISLMAQTTSDVYAYDHRNNGQKLRRLIVCEWEVHTNLGDEEAWEEQARAQYAKRAGETAEGWPRMFDADQVIEGFLLPSPWSNRLPLKWDIDIRLS